MNTDHNHLDAETVAAWMDGGLDATSFAAAEAHASNCERCQALLATVAKTVPPDVPVVSGFSRIWKWWLAPLAATAAAVTLWMVVPQDRMRPESLQSKADVAQQPQAPAAVIEAPPATTSAPAAPAADARFSESRRNVPAPRTTQTKEVEAKAKLADAQGNRADTAPQRDRQEKREANLERAAPAEPTAAAAAPAPPSGAIGNVPAVTPLRKQTAPLELVSPDPRFRWRVTGNTIEHTQDGGRNWIPVRLTVNEIITGGSAPAPLACWFVGRRGLVLLATDGTNFTPLPFPERVDLTSVTATDARRAIVTAADGRTFSTEDSGRNWR